MDSDKFLCVREAGPSGPQLLIVDIARAENIFKRQISADSVIMSPAATPSSKIVALRAKVDNKTTTQVFNLDTKQKLKEWTCSEDIHYWRWISASAIAIITPTKVYHWTLSTQSDPTPVFDRHSSLFDTQIINYQVSPDEKWMCLVGLGSANGRIAGKLQLYSVEKGISQPIEGHAATFCHYKIEGNPLPSQLFCFAVNSPTTGGKLFIIEPQKPDQNRLAFPKKTAELHFPVEFASDFPVSIQVSERYSVIYIITKAGFLYLFDIDSAICLFAQRITSANDSFFTSTKYDKDGFIGVGKEGIVLSVKLNEDAIVNYIQTQLGNGQLAVSFASRNNLLTPETGAIFTTNFNNLLAAGQFVDAARLAAKSPGGVLRNLDTIRKLQNTPASPGMGGESASPVLVYFQTLLESGKLNMVESLEISKPILRSGRFQFIENWLKEDKIEASEELGDEIRNTGNSTLALSAYLRANVPSKVIQCFAETGQFDKIILYAKKVNYQPNYPDILRQVVRADPEKALNLAKMAISNQTFVSTTGKALEGSNDNMLTTNISLIADVFIEANCVVQATSFLLDALQQDHPEDADLQTKLLEINLNTNPQIADAILSKSMLHHYNKSYIATLCENAGLYQRALENYVDIYDIKRAIIHTNMINSDWLVQFFGGLSVEHSYDCIEALLDNNAKMNLQVVIKIAQAYHAQLGLNRLLELFDRHNSNEAVFFLLGAAIGTSEDPEIHFRYIEAAVKLGQMKEIERVIKESNHYDPERVKNFLKEQKLSDQLPLIILCDRFNYVHDLVLYLYRNHLQKYIEIYVQKVNPSRLPEIVGGLLDVDCPEDTIKSLIMSVSMSAGANSVQAAFPFSIADLSSEMEKRNALKTLLPWLELQANNGNEHVDIYNTLAKIYIESGYNAERFLRENPLYDSLLVGAYCEKHDPQLACIAYERGLCDEELVRLCVDSALYKNLARYLVKRRDMQLWLSVIQNKDYERRPHQNEFAVTNHGNGDAGGLSDDIDHESSPLRAILDQVVQTALPETSDPEDITVAVKAFMSADMPSVLIELLEKIILDKNSVFSDNRNLQNLLILTTIKSNSSKIMEYSNALDNYDAVEIAKVAIENQLYEEAYAIYCKNNLYKEALSMLLTNINDMKRAVAYVEKISLLPNDESANENGGLSQKLKKQLYTLLAKSQLDKNMIRDSIQSYIKADDCTNLKQIIDAVKGAPSRDLYLEDMIVLLRLAYNTQNSKEPLVEYNLLYFLAENGIRHSEASPDTTPFADILDTKIREKKTMYCDLLGLGDLFYKEAKYVFAKLCYAYLNNYAKLASTLVYLGEFQNAVDCARKANTTQTWREVCLSCLSKKEYKLAQTCAMNIITHPDELASIIKVYLSKDLLFELVSMLELYLSTSATVNNNICTELAILYTEHSYMYDEQAASPKHHINNSNGNDNGSGSSSPIGARMPTTSKAMAHLQKYWSKINIPKVLKVAEKNHMWKEMVFLHAHFDGHDNAIKVMIKHPAVAFEHGDFKESILKVTNTDLYYKALEFYLNHFPNFFNDLLLNCLGPRLEPTRVIKLFQTSLCKVYDLPVDMLVLKDYLFSLQKVNNKIVNECIHKMLIEEEDLDALKAVVLNPDYDNFDQLKLAEQLEVHPNGDLRRLAAKLYHSNKKFDKAVLLSKTDNLYDEAIRFACESRDHKQVYELLEFFIKEPGHLILFSTCLYQCYDLIKPDVVLQLAWQHKQMDAAMPFFIQSLADLTTKVDHLMKENQDLKTEVKKNEEENKKQSNTNAAMNFNMLNAGAYPSNMVVPLSSTPYAPHVNYPVNKMATFQR